MQDTSTSTADLINVAGPRVRNASWSVSAAQSATHKFQPTISNKANLIPEHTLAAITCSKWAGNSATMQGHSSSTAHLVIWKLWLSNTLTSLSLLDVIKRGVSAPCWLISMALVMPFSSRVIRELHGSTRHLVPRARVARLH